MANIYLGSELLNGGGSSSSEQLGAINVTSLAIWSGTYQEYQDITTPDANTVYFVKGKQSSFVPSSFTINQSITSNVQPNTNITYSVTGFAGDLDNPEGDNFGDFTYKWWVNSTSIPTSDFNVTGVGTSKATATAISNYEVVLNTSTEDTVVVNVAVFDGTRQVGTDQAFTSVEVTANVTLSITSSYSGASFFWQCGGPSVSGTVQGGSGSIRIGGEVDPDQPVSQSYSRTSGDATMTTEICNGWSDGFGYRMHAGYQDSTMVCYFNA